MVDGTSLPWYQNVIRLNSASMRIEFQVELFVGWNVVHSHVSRLYLNFSVQMMSLSLRCMCSYFSETSTLYSPYQLLHPTSSESTSQTASSSEQYLAAMCSATARYVKSMMFHSSCFARQRYLASEYRQTGWALEIQLLFSWWFCCFDKFVLFCRLSSLHPVFDVKIVVFAAFLSLFGLFVAFQYQFLDFELAFCYICFQRLFPS